MNEDVRLRFFQPGDEESLLALFQRVFEGWPMVDAGVEPIEHLRWKLSSHPAASRYLIVAEAGSRLVAARPFFVQQVKIGGRVGLLRNGFDSAVDPGYQRRGVMAAIRKFETERFTGELDLHIGYGRHPAILRLRKKEDIHYFGNPVDVLTLAVSEPPVAPAKTPWNIVGCERFDERVDVLYEEAARPFDLVLVRNRDYLNWRYCDPRAGAFRVRVAESERQILGYTVLAAAKGRAQIADVLALPGRLDVVASLVDDAIARTAASHAGALECWCQTHHPYKSVFLDRGFLPKRTIKLTYLALRAPRSEIDFLASPKAAVHFQLGDTDLV